MSVHVQECRSGNEWHAIDAAASAIQHDAMHRGEREREQRGGGGFEGNEGD